MIKFPSYKVRFKHDYLKLIRDHGYEQRFNWFKLDHPKLSENRAARAFCLKNDLVKFSEWRILDYFNIAYDVKDWV